MTPPFVDGKVIQQAFDTPTVVAAVDDYEIAAFPTAAIGGCFSIRFVRSCAGFPARVGSLVHSLNLRPLTAAVLSHRPRFFRRTPGSGDAVSGRSHTDISRVVIVNDAFLRYNTNPL